MELWKTLINSSKRKKLKEIVIFSTTQILWKFKRNSQNFKSFISYKKKFSLIVLRILRTKLYFLEDLGWAFFFLWPNLPWKTFSLIWWKLFLSRKILFFLSTTEFDSKIFYKLIFFYLDETKKNLENYLEFSFGAQRFALQ